MLHVSECMTLLGVSCKGAHIEQCAQEANANSMHMWHSCKVQLNDVVHCHLVSCMTSTVAPAGAVNCMRSRLIGTELDYETCNLAMLIYVCM